MTKKFRQEVKRLKTQLVVSLIMNIILITLMITKVIIFGIVPIISVIVLIIMFITIRRRLQLPLFMTELENIINKDDSLETNKNDIND